MGRRKSTDAVRMLGLATTIDQSPPIAGGLGSVGPSSSGTGTPRCVAVGPARRLGRVVAVLQRWCGVGSGRVLSARPPAARFVGGDDEASQLGTMMLIVEGVPLPTILRSVVDVVESRHPGMMCSVLLLDEHSRQLRLGAAPSLPADYNAAIDGVTIGPAVGSCGTAAFTGERVVAVDIQSDPQWADYRDLAARAGLRSCWSQPVFGRDHRVLGTFAIYHAHPHAPSAADIDTITTAARFAAVAIERTQNDESLRRRTAFFEAQVECSRDGILVVDRTGRIIQHNRRLAEIWHIPPEIANGGDDAVQLAFVTGQTKNPAAFVARVKHLYAHPTEFSRDEIETVDGRVLDRDSAPVHDAAGNYHGRIWTFRDITERKRSEEALRASEERWSFALEGAGDGVWDWDVTTGVTNFSKRYKQMLGYGEHELAEGFRDWERLVHPEDLPPARAAVEAYLSGASTTFADEFRMQCRDGSWKWILARGKIVRRDAGGKPLRLVGTHTDISDRRAMEEELRTAARMDKLTGLPNRAMILDRLQVTIARHKRDPACRYAVLFLDFDRFKLVNDTLGHDAGDQLLRAVARRLETAVRAVDSVGREADPGGARGTASRLGGDEFVILLTDLRAEGDATLVADRVLAATGTPYTLGGVEVVSTASIGIVTSEFGHDRAEDVLRDADTAMYEAKVAGRGRAATFDASMRTRVQRKVDLERGLRRALDAGQFVLHYQPIVSLGDGRVEGFEALVRWQHPQHGMISPGEFIPVAEETGLIVPLGEWVFREVCRQVVAWRTPVGRDLLGGDGADGPVCAGPVAEALGRSAIPPIGVNLSRAQLALRHLPDQLATITAEAGVEPAAIHLEVTESAVMADAQQAVRLLRRIKGMGFGVHLDDFGTGYSSLSSLHQFPLDVLKIDRSFVTNLSRGSEAAAMIGAIATLARNLGMGVIAEGIETAEQAEQLRALDCGNGQGYLFAKPMPADRVPAYLAANRAAPQGSAARLPAA
jgi:diguanylate cyclase (GGDEF)-like protein/PAS domain S-box-containing protein